MTSAISSWRRPAAVFLLTAAFSSGCDLSTKTWAQNALEVPGGSMTVVDPWLQFSLAYNRGTAFSLIPQLGEARFLFAILALVVCGALLWMALRRRPVGKLELLALGTIAGGALGNGYDRAFRTTPAGDTAVIDFIRVNFSSTLSWPTFNLADAFILIGVGVVLWLEIRRPREPDELEEGATAAAAAQS